MADRALYSGYCDGVSIICGGFPCQDISNAGKRAGITGERSGLWRNMVEAIRVARPKYVILENVAALLGRGMGDVLADLAALGYDAEWHCIPASAVGAPHRRDRVWVVAYPRSEQYESRGPSDEGPTAEGLHKADLADAPELLGNGRKHNARSNSECGGPLPKSRDGSGDENVADAARPRLSDNRGRRAFPKLDWQRALDNASCRSGRRDDWGTEPDVGRVAHGVSSRVDRLSGLGNAVVPQIPELIGRAILEAEGLA